MATINVPEYDRQQYETAMQSIKNSTPIITPEPAPTPATTAAKPAPVPILAPTTPERKSVLYGGESISNPDTLNTTVDTIRENVKKFSGVQQVEKELNADILKLYYPVFGDHIDYARAMGYDDSEIREYLEGRETLARLQHPQHDINAYLQRTPEGMALAAAAERRRMIDAYVQASGLEREDVEDRMAVAEALMLSP